jgi:hypothetical protein
MQAHLDLVCRLIFLVGGILSIAVILYSIRRSL